MQLKVPYFFLLSVVIIFPPGAVFAAPYFNPAALGLNGDGQVMDPAQFQYLRERQFQEEGRYFVAVTVNQQVVSSQWLEFRYHPQQKKIAAGGNTQAMAGMGTEPWCINSICRNRKCSAGCGYYCAGQWCFAEF
ncbi:FimD/PapC N-terminal domain-containing protein [Morganella morganii]|uniref:FimD/PapC N-terminal domain-containing protein n=1 Tax=Morganella morganii TaxID=582 RepID=UPI0030FE7246